VYLSRMLWASKAVTLIGSRLSIAYNGWVYMYTYTPCYVQVR